MVMDFDDYDDPDAFDSYQGIAMDFAVYPGMMIYPALGLAGEAGEVAEKVKKLVRDDLVPLDENFNTARNIDYKARRDLALELGDVLWYVAVLADDIGYSLSEIAEMNIDKLSSRKRRGKIAGSGDFR